MKFAEYAIMRYSILSADTLGLKTQADRMNLPSPVPFIAEDPQAWADMIVETAETYTGLEPLWEDAATWSYPDIFRRQVLGLYQKLSTR